MKEQETLPPSVVKTASDQFHMVDVGGKQQTFRIATAEGRIFVGEDALQKIVARKMFKGDVLGMAEVAGIQAAKRTSELLPLCHPIALDSIDIRCFPENATHSILVQCTAKAFAKTGVEMEALMGVQGALLSIYDLTKAIEPALKISDIRLVEKVGGKKGHWKHPDCIKPSKGNEIEELALQGVVAATITVSDRCASGLQTDVSGKVLKEELTHLGAVVEANHIRADNETQIVETVLELASSASVSLIVTTGGTGLGPRDVTIRALKKVASKEIPGFGELMRHQSSRLVSTAWLSGGSGFVVKDKLVIALPGSPKAVKQCLGFLKSQISHAIHTISGGGHG